MSLVVTPSDVHVRSGPAAAEIAGISYRQLDHWERQGWIKASQVEAVSSGRRLRRYTTDDIVQLAALRHLSQSGLAVAEWGPRVGEVTVPEGHVLVVGSEDLEVIETGVALDTLSTPGRWTVFDPTAIRRRCAIGEATQAHAKPGEIRDSDDVRRLA